MRQLSTLLKSSYGLVAASAGLLWLGYLLAFRPTLQAWQLRRQYQQQLTAAADLTNEPGYLIRKNHNLDALLGHYRLDTLTFRGNTVNTLTAVAERLNVRPISVPADDATFHTGQYVIQKMDFEGDFFQLLRLVDELQHTQGIGLLRSAAWTLEKSTFGTPVSKGRVQLELYLIIAK